MLENLTFHSDDFDIAKQQAFLSAEEKMGIPTLREDMIYQGVPSKIFCGGNIDEYDNTPETLVLYGQTSNTQAMFGSILGFFVDDAKFGATWYKMHKFVDKLKEIQPHAVLMPNFSLWRDDPLPEQLYNWYKTMLVSRIWQEMGIKVGVVLNWGSPESYKFSVLGVPQNLEVVFCQGRNIRVGDENSFIDGLEYMYKNLHFKSVMIYGGYENPKLIELCQERMPELVIVPFMSWNTKKRKIERQALIEGRDEELYAQKDQRGISKKKLKKEQA